MVKISKSNEKKKMKKPRKFQAEAKFHSFQQEGSGHFFFFVVNPFSGIFLIFVKLECSKKMGLSLFLRRKIEMEDDQQEKAPVWLQKRVFQRGFLGGADFPAFSGSG